MYLPQYLYYGASVGSYLFPSFLYFSSSPHRLTCPFLPPWPSAPSTFLLFKGAWSTSDRRRADVDARAEQQPGSTLAVSLPENLISEGDGSDDAQLRWLKLSATFFLSHILLYSGVSYIPYLVCYLGWGCSQVQCVVIEVPLHLVHHLLCILRSPLA